MLAAVLALSMVSVLIPSSASAGENMPVAEAEGNAVDTAEAEEDVTVSEGRSLSENELIVNRESGNFSEAPNELAEESADSVNSGTCGEGVTWKIVDRVLIISGSGIIEPDKGDSLWDKGGFDSAVIEDGVTGIGERAFYNCYCLTNIDIPSSVASIGERAFRDCSKLSVITIPEGVINIEAYVFADCSELVSVTLSSTVSSIAETAFSGCDSLAEFWVDQENISYCVNDGILFNKERTELIKYPQGRTDIQYYIPDGTTSIGESAFKSCRNLCTVMIPEGVTSIGKNGFSSCSNLSDLEIPSSVINIGNAAFSGSGLSDVKIPSGVTSIGKSAFERCDNLTSVNIPTSVTSIESSAFNSCISLGEITIPASVSEIGEYAFQDCIELISVKILNDTCIIADNEETFMYSAAIYGNANSSAQAYAEKYTRTFALLSDSIPQIVEVANGKCGNAVTWKLMSDGVLTISGDGTMYDYDDRSYPWNARRIIYVQIDEGVTNIGNCAFYLCGNLKEAKIPNSVVNIGNSAFYYCTNLKSIDLPENLEKIGNQAFTMCKRLKKVEIPKSVEEIQYKAFQNCSSLEHIQLREGLKTLGYGVFGYTSVTELSLPASLETIDGFWTNALKVINVDKNNAKFSSSNGVLYNKDKTVLICYPCEKEGDQFTVPSTVTQIADRAFWACKNLENITLFPGIVSIGEYAFAWVERMSSIVLPSTVSSIGEYMFYESSVRKISVFNDACEIKGTLGTVSGWTTIYGHIGSTAQTYAEKNGCIFEELREEEVTPSPEDVIDSGVCEDGLKWKLASDGTLTISGKGPMKDYMISGWGNGDETTAPWGEYANYENLKVMIADGVTSVGNYAFTGMHNMESVIISSSVKSIGKLAFGGFMGAKTVLKSVKLNDGLTQIGDSAFFGGAFSEITIPSTVTSIGDSAFSNCSELKKITILNDTCEITDNQETISGTAVIYGQPDSTAQAYAEKYNRKFELVKENPPITGSPVVPVPPADTSPTVTETPPAVTASPTPTASPSVTTPPEVTETISPTGTVTPIPQQKTAQEIQVRYSYKGKKFSPQKMGSRLGVKAVGNKTKVTFTSSNPKIVKVGKTSGNIICAGVGKAVITIKAEETDQYQGAVRKVTLSVIPKTAGIKSVKSVKKGQVIIKSNSVAKGNDGYQFQYKYAGKIKKADVKSKKTAVLKLKLKSGRNFKVRVRAYKKVAGKVYYGKFGKWKTLKKVK